MKAILFSVLLLGILCALGQATPRPYKTPYEEKPSAADYLYDEVKPQGTYGRCETGSFRTGSLSSGSSWVTYAYLNQGKL